MKNLLKNIALGSLALLVIATATAKTSEQTPVKRAIQSLGEKFSKIDAQEEKWVNSLEASNISMLDNYLKQRIGKVSLKGVKSSELLTKLRSKSEQQLVNDYLEEESLGEFSTAPSQLLAGMTEEDYTKLVTSLRERNKQAIQKHKDLVQKSAKITGIYRKARRDLPK